MLLAEKSIIKFPPFYKLPDARWTLIEQSVSLCIREFCICLRKKGIFGVLNGHLNNEPTQESVKGMLKPAILRALRCSTEVLSGSQRTTVGKEDKAVSCLLMQGFSVFFERVYIKNKIKSQDGIHLHTELKSCFEKL